MCASRRFADHTALFASSKGKQERALNEMEDTLTENCIMQAKEKKSKL